MRSRQQQLTLSDFWTRTLTLSRAAQVVGGFRLVPTFERSLGTHAFACALPLVVVLAVCIPSLAAAVDPELAKISARKVDRTEVESELLEAWWSHGANLGRDFLERVREQALEDPSAVEMMELYVQAATAQQDTARLHDDLEALLAQDPEEARHLYYLGLTSNQEEGRVLFQKALEQDSKFAPALVALASLDLSGPQPDLADIKERLLRAARNEPDNFRAFSVLSQLYGLSNDPESRLLALRRGIETDPTGGRPRQALFEALREGANEAQKSRTLSEWSEQTATFLEEVGKSLPEQSALLYTAARIWMSVSEQERAITDLQMAVAAGFDDPIALENDGAFAQLKQSERLVPLIAQAAANRAANEADLRRELRYERLDLPAPDFELPRQGGGSVKLSELRGKVVILDFWATWCGPCRRALPTLQSYYESKHANVEVFCVNVFERDGGKSVEPFWKQGGFPMPVLLGTNEVAQQFAVQSIPTLFVIGPDGRIAYRHQGFTPYLPERLRWMAEDLLGL